MINLSLLNATSTNNLNFMQRVWSIVVQHYPIILGGVGKTLLVAVIGTVVGLIIGVLVGVLRTYPLSKNRIVRFFQKMFNTVMVGYIEIFRGTPMMVQAMVLFYGYSELTQIRPDVEIASIIIVSINTGAYMAEIVRGGIISIDKGQVEGAYAVGMTHTQTMFYVVIPQMFKNILPAISNEFVINVKDTSVLNVIGLWELYRIGDKIIKYSFSTFEVYLIICVIYFILTFTITRILRLIEKKLEGNSNYTICGSQSDPKAQIRIIKESNNG